MLPSSATHDPVYMQITIEIVLVDFRRSCKPSSRFARCCDARVCTSIPLKSQTSSHAVYYCRHVASHLFDNSLYLPLAAYPFGGLYFKAARELAESRSGTSIRTPRHEVLDGTESVTLNVELPGCKKQDVDAHILGDDGEKTLRITAVRKRPRNTESSSGSDDSGNRDEGPPGRTATESSPWTEEIFELSFRLGENIDVSGVRGKMEDGILTLILPRVPPEPPAEPIDIPIEFPEEGNGGADKDAPRGSKGVEEPAGGLGGHQDRSFNTHISLS